MTAPRKRSSSNGKPRETFLETFPRPPKHARVLFAGYPAGYSVAMSNLGFHFLYGSLARSGRFRVERFFGDTSPVTFESGRRIRDASALLVSISYEEDYLDLVRILIGSGIEPEREKRRGEPLVIAGGPAVSSNPLPLSDIIDVAVLGEGETAVGILADLLDELPDGSLPDLPLRLAGREGFFLPGVQGSKASFSGERQKEVFTRSVIISPDTVFSDTMLFETGRGCAGSCGFCLATSIYRPLRAVSIASIEKALDGLDEPVKKAGLVSTAVTAHPRFHDLVDLFLRRGISLGFSSINASGLDAGDAAIIARAGARSVSLAPESGSEKLRKRLGKNVPDEAYIDAVGLLAASGISNIGLYFLTGYPGEDENTIDRTRLFLEKIRRSAGRAALTVSVNAMVPKPWTPLQYYPMPGADILRTRIEAIRAVCRKIRINCQAKSLRSSMRQAVLSVGGREVGMALISYSSGGISWRKALASSGVDPDLPNRERGIEGSLPWSVIEGPEGGGTLLDRYRKIIA